MFENMAGDINGTALTAGSADDFPGIFGEGILNPAEENMSCNRATNPANNDGTTLIDTNGYPNCNYI